MISFICPVIRPEGFKILEESIKKYCTKYEYEIISEEDTERIGCPKMVKKLIRKAKGNYICYLGDDCELLEGTIDNAMKEMKNFIGGCGLIGFNDQNWIKGTHWIAHRKMEGYYEDFDFFYTGYQHNFCDDELVQKAKMANRYKWCENAKILHKHPAFNKGEWDEDYKRILKLENFNKDKELFVSRNGKLAVLMIVKNEEAMLEECLESVKEADQIIIVDTGSTDKTVEIAKKYTDKIYYFEWCDDFSKARNYAIEKHREINECDWILSIDADEVLQEGGIQKLKEYFNTPLDAIGVYMKGGCEYHVPRCFRNVPYIEWKGKIHEILNYTPRTDSDVSITYRSSPAHKNDPKRNLRILEKAHEEEPNNTRYLFYLGREYYYYKDWEKAKDTLNRYTEIATWLPELADAYYLLAQCYWYDGKGNGNIAREMAMRAIIVNPEFSAPYKLMADMVWGKYRPKWLKLAELATNEDVLFIH